MKYTGRQITTYELMSLKKNYCIEIGLLTIVAYGNNDFEIFDPWGTSLWQGDAESTVGYSNGFNGHDEIVETIEELENNG